MQILTQTKGSKVVTWSKLYRRFSFELDWIDLNLFELIWLCHQHPSPCPAWCAYQCPTINWCVAFLACAALMRQSLAWSVDVLGSLFSSTSNREEHQPINTKSTMKVTSIWLAALAVALWPSNGAFADQGIVGTELEEAVSFIDCIVDVRVCSASWPLYAAADACGHRISMLFGWLVGGRMRETFVGSSRCKYADGQCIRR